MTVTHRPDEELMMAYAAGNLPEPVSLLVATHMALCPESRSDVRRFEDIGGALLEQAQPEVVSASCRSRVLAALDRETMEPVRPVAAEPESSDVPRPLRDYIGPSLDTVKWTNVGIARYADLLTDYPGYQTRLLWVKPGRAMPEHTHEGREYTLVLRGGYTDVTGHFRRGDVCIADSALEHQPVADDDDDCICLTVADAPLRLTGRFGKYLNPLTRW